MFAKKGAKRRLISHLYMWVLVAAGVFLVFIFIPSGTLLFKKNIQVSFSAVVVGVLILLFLIYYIPSAIWERKKFKLYSGSEMKRMIEMGVYGKVVHPTCTTLAFLGWVVFCIIPDLRIFLAVSWFTLVLVFWIRAEKSFFLGKKLGVEDKGPEPA